MNLATFLQSHGYIEVPLKKSIVGHLEVGAKVNGEDALFILDTGAARTVFDNASTERLHMKCEVVEGKAAGLGVSDKPVLSCTLESFEIGALSISSLKTLVIDLSNVNRILEKKGAATHAGVLGADVLTEKSAIIDYKSLKLYLKDGQE